MTIKELFDTFIEYKKYSVSDGTVLRYQVNFNNFIYPYFADTDIISITSDMALSFRTYLTTRQSKYGHTLASQTINNCLTVLSSMYNMAIRYGYVTANPFYRITITRTDKVPRLALAPECYKDLTKYLKKNPNYLNISILLGLYAGLRLGEVCGLRWKDVNFSDGSLNIINSLTQHKNTADGTYEFIDSPPKTKHSIRVIPIPPFLVQELRQCRKTNLGDYVVSNKKGEIPTPKYISRRFKLITKELNFDEKVCFHSLRHTYATRALEAGIDIKTLSELMGHSSVTITMTIYTHISYIHKKEQVKKYIKR